MVVGDTTVKSVISRVISSADGNASKGEHSGDENTAFAGLVCEFLMDIAVVDLVYDDCHVDGKRGCELSVDGIDGKLLYSSSSVCVVTVILL